MTDGPSWSCPLCGYVTNSSMKIGEAATARPAPRTGDVSICLRCGEPGVFDHSPLGVLFVRIPSVIELAVFMGNERVTGAMAMVKEAREETRARGERWVGDGSPRPIFTATAVRVGELWVLSVEGVGTVEARSLRRAKVAVRDMLSVMRDLDKDAFSVVIDRQGDR